MATFAPRTDDVGIPNSTGVSQGTGANRTFEVLFSGLTNTAKNVINVKDTQTQLDIQDQAQQGFDQVNNEFGLTPPDSGPAGLTSELDRVQALQSAVEQGKISQVNYYGRLATLSKQLRTKYPGYEHIVDQTIQSVTGTRPANAYRDAIFQEIGNLSEAASSDEKFKRQFNKENADVLSVLYGDDYFADPSKYDFNKVQADVGRLKGKAFQIDAAKKEIDLMNTQGEFNEKEAQKVAGQDLSFIVQSTLNKSTGANGPSFKQTIDQFVAQGGGSGPQLQEFINNISMAESTIRATLYDRVQKEYVSKRLITPDAANKLVEDSLYPITKAKEAVLGGDFKLASKYATINKDIEDQQLSEMLKDPTVLAGSGLKNLNEALGDTYFNENRDAVSNVAAEVAGRIIGGNPEALGAAVDSGNQKVARSAIDMTFKAIVDPKLQGDGFSNAIKSTFGPQAKDFMSPKVVAPSDLEALYLKFLNPEVTKAIVTKGTPEDLKMYTDWALEKAQAIPAFRAAAGDLNAIRGLNSDIQFQFDPKTYKLTATIPGMPTGLGSAKEALQGGTVTKTTGRTLDAFNKAMVVLRPIFDANGDKDGLEMAKGFVKSLNVDLEGGSKQGFWSKVWESIPDDLTKPVGEVLKGQEIAPVQSEDAGEIDFSEEEDYDQSLAEDEDAPVPEARPRGMEALAPKGLKTSNIRGYNPDVGNLRPALVTKLTELQSAFGSDLPIVSGFRDPVRNRKAGGAKHSQHMGGKAVDIDVRGLSIGKRKDLIMKARAMGFGGVGIYPNSLHLDIGPVRAWGPNYHNTSLPKWAREVL